MPRLSTRLPKYSRHKQRNLAFVRLDGKQRMLGAYDSPESRQNYDRLISIWIDNGRKLPSDWKNHLKRAAKPCSKPDGASTQNGSVHRGVTHETTIGEVIAEYVPFAKRYYDGNRTYEQIVQVSGILRNSFERMATVNFGPEQLHELRNYWVASGWGRKHANNMTNNVVAIFRWAAEKSASPNSKLDVPLFTWQTLKTVRGLPKGRPLFNYDGSILHDEDGAVIVPHEGKISPPVESETVRRTLEFLPEITADMVRFQQATGCRPGEVCQLRPCEVDRSTEEVWLYRPPKHKTDHVESDDGRVIPIGKSAQAVLRPYLHRDSKTFCFSPIESERRRREACAERRQTPRSCGNRAGSNCVDLPKRKPGIFYTVSAYNKAIKRAVERANRSAATDDEKEIEPWSANQLRKAYALRIRYEEGLGLDHAQVVLGHKQRATTEKWYARNRADIKAIEVARAIG